MTVWGSAFLLLDRTVYSLEAGRPERFLAGEIKGSVAAHLLGVRWMLDTTPLRLREGVQRIAHPEERFGFLRGAKFVALNFFVAGVAKYAWTSLTPKGQVTLKKVAAALTPEERAILLSFRRRSGQNPVFFWMRSPRIITHATSMLMVLDSIEARLEKIRQAESVARFVQSSPHYLADVTRSRAAYDRNEGEYVDLTADQLRELANKP